jgi:response regulator RpfG family c-di-GMP phosphodiesterase
MTKKLLIIDDDKNILEVIEELLKDKFDTILSASNVDQSIKRLEENQFDLIILDINLEGRNGAEIVKYLIEHQKNKNNSSPIIINSGIINQSFVSKNIKKFAGILMKPFEHNELVTMVDNILTGKSNHTESDSGYDDIPIVPCKLPFTVAQLEVRVTKALENVKKSSKLKELFQNLKLNREGDSYMAEHVGMLINISTAISIALEWNTDKTLEKFVYAAYLHDMALTDRPELAKIYSLQELDQKKETLSREDYKLVFEHTNIAAKKIEEIIEIPADVATIVRQHHENPKERGWPLKIASAKISPLSSVFIVAHDLTNFIFLNPEWTIASFIQKYRPTYKGPHFSKALQVLEKLK